MKNYDGKFYVRDDSRNPFLNQVHSDDGHRREKSLDLAGRNPFLNQVHSDRGTKELKLQPLGAGSQSLLKSGPFRLYIACAPIGEDEGRNPFLNQVHSDKSSHQRREQKSWRSQSLLKSGPFRSSRPPVHRMSASLRVAIPS